MGPLADPQDVAGIWRPLSDAETQVVAARIERASRLLRRKVQQATGSSLDDLVTAGSVDALAVSDLVAEMVLRIMTVPSLVRQQSVTVDDATIATTFDASVSGRSGLYVTAEEVADLLGSLRRSRAFTIIPGAGRSWNC